MGCGGKCVLQWLHQGFHNCCREHRCNAVCYLKEKSKPESCNKICNKYYGHVGPHICDKGERDHRCNRKCQNSNCNRNCILTSNHDNSCSCGQCAFPANL